MTTTLVLNLVDLCNYIFENESNNTDKNNNFKDAKNIANCNEALKWINYKINNFGLNSYNIHELVYEVLLYYPKKSDININQFSDNLNNQLFALFTTREDIRYNSSYTSINDIHFSGNSVNKNSLNKKEALVLPFVSYTILRKHKDSNLKNLEKIIINKTEGNFINILEKMNLYALRKRYYIKCKVYNLGDFNLKIGYIAPSKSDTDVNIQNNLFSDNSNIEKAFLSIESNINKDIGLFMLDVLETLLEISRYELPILSDFNYSISNKLEEYLERNPIYNSCICKELYKDLINANSDKTVSDNINKRVNNYQEIYQLIELIFK